MAGSKKRIPSASEDTARRDGPSNGAIKIGEGKARLIQKAKDYQDYLNAQIALNAKYDESNAILYKSEQLGIEPTIAKITSAEEELKDQVLQRQKANDTLKLLLKPKDVQRALNRLAEEKEIEVFNSFSSRFLNEIRGQQNITPEKFNDLWRRYNLKLELTNDTGIPIDKADEYDEKLREIAQNLKLIIEARPDLNIGEKWELKEKVADAVIERNIELLDKVEDGLNKGLSPTTILKTPTQSPTKTPKAENSPSLSKKNPKAKKATFAETVYSIYNQVFDEKNLDSLSEGTVKDMLNALESFKPPKSRKTDTEKDHYRVKYVLEHFLYTKKPMNQAQLDNINSITMTNLKKLEEELGKKIARANMNLLQKGSGVQKVDTWNKLEPFGRYLILIPKLEKNILALRYKSKNTLKHFPDKMVSNQFAKIIWTILQTGQFSKEAYNDLSKDEQKHLDTVIILTKSEKGLGVDLQGKYTDPKRKENIERFQLLRNQIIAGNDSKEVLKELKALLLKFIAEKSISRAQAEQTLYEIVALT
jgi:hypothetical protein